MALIGVSTQVFISNKKSSQRGLIRDHMFINFEENSSTLETGAKKPDWAKNSQVVNNLQFWLYPHETWSKEQPHEVSSYFHQVSWG